VKGELGPRLKIWIKACSKIAMKGVLGGDSDGVSESRPATPRERNVCEDVVLLSCSYRTAVKRL